MTLSKTVSITKTQNSENMWGCARILDVIEHDDGIHQTVIYLGNDGERHTRVEKIHIGYLDVIDCIEDIPF